MSADFFVLNERSIDIFADGGGGAQNWSFFVAVKNV